MSASDDERREELRGRLANVIRIAAGLAANEYVVENWDINQIAARALLLVRVCESTCGIGDTGGSDD